MVTESCLSPAGATYRQTVHEDRWGSFDETITGKDRWHESYCCKQGRIISLKPRDGYDDSPELD